MPDIYNNIATAVVGNNLICNGIANPGGLCFGGSVTGISNSFITGAGPAGLVLTSVGLLLTGVSKTTGGVVIVSLLGTTTGTTYNNPTDPGTPGPVPGALIVQLGIIYDMSILTTNSPFYLIAAQRLVASTRYWISLTDGSQPGTGIVSNVGWAYSLYVPTDLGTTGEYFSDLSSYNSPTDPGAYLNGWNGTVSVDSGPFQMQITTV